MKLRITLSRLSPLSLLRSTMILLGAAGFLFGSAAAFSSVQTPPRRLVDVRTRALLSSLYDEGVRKPGSRTCSSSSRLPTTRLQASRLMDLAEAAGVATGPNILLATIDSDIAKLSDNEFAPIFLGGILVMVGGLLSAVFVGSVVDKKDLYASLVADSYLQDQDEEFWKGLSDEEKKKTQEMLERVRAGRTGTGTGAEDAAATTTTGGQATGDSPASAARARAKAEPVAASKADEPKVEIGMFSDYGDDM